MLKKKLVLITESSKIGGTTYTILTIADFLNTDRFYLLDVVVSTIPVNSTNLVELLESSLSRIGKNLNCIKMIITDAAAYNIAAFKQIQTTTPGMKYITCYSHLLGNIASKIPIYHQNLMEFMIKFGDFFQGL